MPIDKIRAFNALIPGSKLDDIQGLSSEMRQNKLRSLLARFEKRYLIDRPKKMDGLEPYLTSLVQFLVNEVAPTVSTNTFHIYKNSVLPILPNETLRDSLKQAKGIDKRSKEKESSGNRQRFLTTDQLEAITTHNKEVRFKSYLAHITSVKLRATCLVGLRPGEWFDSKVRVCNGIPVLIVKTEKQYAERLTNLKQETGKEISHFLPYRGIPLDHLDETDLTTVKNCVEIHQQVVLTGRDTNKFNVSLGRNLKESTAQLWGTQGAQINFYSARHQFAANMKSSNLQDSDITYLMGQIYDETKHRHYASATKGDYCAVPYAVDEIIEFVKTNINDKLRMRKSTQQ